MKCLVALFLFACCIIVNGQNVDYNKVILPDGVSNASFAEKLVQLAWKNNPVREIQTSNKSIAESNIKVAKLKWLDIFTISGNLNEFTINSSTSNDPTQFNLGQFYPRYNLGATINLSTFFSTPYQVKKSKQMYTIANAEINAEKLNIRSAVLQSYNELQAREKIFRLYSQAKLDAINSHNLVEQRFKQGEVLFESYMTSSNNVNQSRVRELESETQYLNAKVTLEALIGVKLEEVSGREN
jgi:outer membrane protein TolC